MPYRYRYLADRHVLLESLFGRITLQQLVHMKTRQREEGIGGLGLRALVDLRQAQIPRVEALQVKEFVAWMQANLPGQLDTRSALVTREPMETGVSLLYAANMQRAKTVEVFADLSRALQWLDLEESVLDAHRDVIPVGEDAA